jgi:4-amino-4-deoxy-L-arabinose transferase-like glycosyltransferase
MKPHHHLYTLILYFAIQDLRHWIKTNYKGILRILFWYVLIPVIMNYFDFSHWLIGAYLFTAACVLIVIAYTKEGRAE